ncbi:von Willebrand factor type A domain containing protein [Novymonas esmeraldas]|uniref:von Willebrand factor type A domain containing protein n=1 Tax=Novymonas esmeraldas TaxID=1808958 RepID=A0AAW0ETF3_9TRYP
MDASATYYAFPGHDRGVLLATTFKPLSLRAADVHVRLAGYAAQVTLSLEYVNETNTMARVFAAYPTPPGYHLQQTTLQGPTREVTARTFEQSRPLRSVESGGALRAKPLADASAVSVATQCVPWGVGPGEAVLMRAVYHVPIHAAQRTGEVVVQLPATLVPAVQRPPEVQRAYVGFLDARSRERRLTQPSGTLRVVVDAQLLLPLRGVVTLEKGGDVVPELESGGDGGATVRLDYVGDTHFQLMYTDELPAAVHRQTTLCLRIPVSETSEPLRLHTAVAPTSAPGDPTPAAAVALCITPSLASCPSNAEVVFVVDVHSVPLAAAVAESILSAIDSLDGTASRVNVVLCRDAHRGGAVALLPDGAVSPAAVPLDSVSAFIKEEGVQTVASSAALGAAILSPHLPSVLRAVVAGRGVVTSVPAGYVRNIVVLSDGGHQATDAEAAAMVCEVANARRCCRVHAVALAATADVAVLCELVESTGGLFATAVPPRRDGAVDAEEAVDEAVLATVAAAAVPCLVGVRTHWDVAEGTNTSAEAAAAPPPSLLRLAANADGSDVACIPHGTQRVLYGLLRSADTNVSLRLSGRVGETVIEYTASCAVAPAADGSSSSGGGGGDAAAAAAAAASGDDASTAAAQQSTLATAAAAARIAYLADTQHATTEAEAHEVIALSRSLALPSLYTTLTDGTSGPGGEHKAGGVVHLPSLQTLARVDLAIRARRAAVQSAAARASLWTA